MEKQKGWDADYLCDIFELQSTLENAPEKLRAYCDQNPLCALHPNNRKLAIVRKYNFYLDGDLVNMFAGESYGDKGHWGIALIDLDKGLSDELRNPLPQNLNYRQIEFRGDSVLITAEEKQLLTNWNELERKFPFLTNFNERAIVEIYDSLKNDIVLKEIIIRKNPKTSKVETDFIGTLKLNKTKTTFSAKGKWTDKKVTLVFSVDDNGEIKQGLQAAKALWNAQQEWDNKIKTFAAKELLMLKNEDWLDEDKKKLTATQFKNRMPLGSICFYEDGGFQFFFDDGNLFNGHTIQVAGSIDDGLTQALFQG